MPRTLKFHDFRHRRLQVYLLDGDGTVKYETAGRQTPLQPDELTADVANNFIAYSANGTAQVTSFPHSTLLRVVL